MAAVLSVVGGAAFAQTVTVVEYYNTRSNAYFITGRAEEQARLDAEPDFRRTGMTFQARAASAALRGQQAVCRYAIQVTPQLVSHFYGLVEDCALIARLIAEGRIANFTDEGLDFAVEPVRADGTCAAGGFPVYRGLRLGSPVDLPNHRYSVVLEDAVDAEGAGYRRERTVFCVPAATPVTPRPRFDASPTLRNLCATPRTGNNPQGVPYPDRQGTIEDEKRWIRSWVDESYLWYREVPNVDLNLFATPQALFSRLKTPALAASGAPKDRFSFSRPTADVERTNAGVSFGYGVTWAAIRNAPPREWVASVVTPASPADQAGVRRGDRLLSIDGVDFVNGSDVGTLNRGLFPPTIGESHVFVLQPADGTAVKTVTLTSAQVSIAAVPRSAILTTPTGRVGYIALTTFNTFTAEKAIADAVQGLVNAGGVSDLVLDLRYNGGGYLYIASQLGYMIAGPARTGGRVFETTKTNDRKPFGQDESYPFYNVGSGFTGGVARNQPLPTLNLRRVFILTTASSCSASESLI
ncbi:MAG: S41 family peptidase, partial [Casimicrobiaceae bacterium]